MVVPCFYLCLLHYFPFSWSFPFKKLNCQQGFRPHHTKIVIPQLLFQRRAVFCLIVEFSRYPLKSSAVRLLAGKTPKCKNKFRRKPIYIEYFMGCAPAGRCLVILFHFIGRHHCRGGSPGPLSVCSLSFQ